MTSNYSAGRIGESKAVEYLSKQGFRIIDTNWRTKQCEIDIVAQKKSCIYFVEVKSRKSAEQGQGVDYITDAKLRQMMFAAEMWVSSHDWDGDYELSVISVDGQRIRFIERIDV